MSDLIKPLDRSLWTPEQSALFKESLEIFGLLKDGKWTKERKKKFKLAYDAIVDLMPRLFALEQGGLFSFLAYVKTRWPGQESDVLNETMPFLTGARGLLDIDFVDEQSTSVEIINQPETRSDIVICSVNGKETELPSSQVFVRFVRNSRCLSGSAHV